MNRIFIFLGLTALLFSCKQDPINPVNTAIPKVARLKFVHNNVNNIDFHYDALGRVTSINGYMGHSPVNVPLSDSIFHVYFTYNGTAQLPSSFHTRDYGISSNETHRIKYDLNNNPILDSIFVSYPTLTYHATTFFQHNPNWIAFQRIAVGTAGSFSDTLFRENGNFIRLYGEAFDFDNGLNPLNRLNISPIFYVISELHHPNWTYWSMWTLCNKNNYVRRKFYSYPGATTFRDTSDLIFNYNSQGLPEKRYWTETVGIPYRPDTIDIIEYIYQ